VSSRSVGSSSPSSIEAPFWFACWTNSWAVSFSSPQAAIATSPTVISTTLRIGPQPSTPNWLGTPPVI
jgi:hypothetical protein